MIRATIVVAILAQTTECPPTKELPKECVLAYTMSGDGLNAVYRDQKGDIIASPEVSATHEIAAEACAEAGVIKIDITHESPAARPKAPTKEGCVTAATASGNRVSVTLKVGQDCKLQWSAVPTDPGIILPIKVRP